MHVCTVQVQGRGLMKLEAGWEIITVGEKREDFWDVSEEVCTLQILKKGRTWELCLL